MAYYLVNFIEDEEDWALNGEQQLRSGLHRIFPTMDGCGQLKGVNQITFNDVQMSMVEEQKVEWLFANLEDITLEQLENLLNKQ